MRYMVIERFKDVAGVYRRFAEKGRMMPDGLKYIESWITGDLHVCYQLMETDDAALFASWTRNWDDLMEFEITAVLSSAEARARVLGTPT
ncbi:hypothetical protein RAS1_26000 [Phycisphaerae bacterium RAS1]|nr:hypothetical protein RAS1_26000 [Phycisphaerae bacterium RAS1]